MKYFLISQVFLRLLLITELFYFIKDWRNKKTLTFFNDGVRLRFAIY